MAAANPEGPAPMMITSRTAIIRSYFSASVHRIVPSSQAASRRRRLGVRSEATAARCTRYCLVHVPVPLKVKLAEQLEFSVAQGPVIWLPDRTALRPIGKGQVGPDASLNVKETFDPFTLPLTVP